MSNFLPIASRDSKLRNRAVAYAYLLGHLAAVQFTAPEHYTDRVNAWRTNAERLATILGRNLGDDLWDTSLHVKRVVKVKCRGFRIYLFEPPPYFGDGL